MKNKFFFPLCFLVAAVSQAQERRSMTLDDAIAESLANSKVVKVAKAATHTTELKLEQLKNNRLPDITLSGNYQQLFNTTDIDLRVHLPSGDQGASSSGVTPNRLLMGQANASIPIFSGFKIKNSINLGALMVNLSDLQTESYKEEVVLQAIELYFGLYKSQHSIEVLKENLIRANQRVKDFQNFLDNGIIARNDLLRAKLQASNVQIAIEEAQTNEDNINLRLMTLMGNTSGDVVKAESQVILNSMSPLSGNVSHRKDIQQLELKEQMADKSIEISKSNYYPQIALTAGYAAFDLDKVATVTNATNVGIGLKYDLGSLYKNKTNVAIAQAEKAENMAHLESLKDRAKLEINEAYKNFTLTQKKNKVYGEALEQARENYRIVKDKYDNGLSDTDQLLEADVAQLQAEINQVVGEANQQLAVYNYLYYTGTLLDNVQ